MSDGQHRDRCGNSGEGSRLPVESREHLEQQLRFSRGLNRMADAVLAYDDTSVLLETLAEVVGKALGVDRALIYDVNFGRHQAIGFCEWLNPAVASLGPTVGTYSLDYFLGSARYSWETRLGVESHFDAPNPHMRADGSAEVLHGVMGIRSLFWHPFAFRAEGFYSLNFNQVTRRRTWTDDERAFIASISRQVDIALQKIHLLEQRRAAQAALHDSEERYRAFFDDDLTAAFTASPDGGIRECNPAFARLFGFSSPEDAPGFDLDRLCPAGAGPIVRMLDLVRAHGRIERTELELQRRDGASLHVVARLIGRVDGRGQLLDIKGYLFDDTDRRRLQAHLLQAQKMDGLGKMAGGIAHDFNNVLAGILGHAELGSARLAQDSPAQRHLAHIEELARKAAAITRQLLTFSRSQVLAPSPIRVNELVTELLALLRTTLGGSIDLTLDLAPDVAQVDADKTQLEQVLLNLCLNARDAMPRGGALRIQTSNAEGQEARRHVLLAVGDTGVGMDDAVLARIFEPFFTTKAPERGTGLGLSMVHGIVAQHGGFVEVDSTPGRGSTFRVYLPVSSRKASRPQPPPQPRPLEGAERILLVEDDDTLRGLFAEMLERNGYRVRTAPNGEEALRRAEEESPAFDLIISDVVMPRMDGRALDEQVSLRRPGTRFLFLSGGTSAPTETPLPSQEATDIVHKPFAAEDFLAKVREILERR